MTFFNAHCRSEKTTILDQEINTLRLYTKTLGSNLIVCICNSFKNLKANLKLILQLCSSQGIWKKFTGARLVTGAQILLKLTFKEKFLLSLSV